MKTSKYKSTEELPLFLNAATVAEVLGVAPSSAYELMLVGTSSLHSVSGSRDSRKLHIRSLVPPLRLRPAALGSEPI